jgi:hypothetical protein
VIRVALALMGVGLGALLAFQWRDWPPPPPGSQPVGDVPAVPGGAARPEPDPLARLTPPEPREELAAVTDRPLFRPQRKPPEPEEQEPEAAPEPEEATDLAGFDLSAVVLTPGVTSAWVKTPGGMGLERLRLGDDLAGWAVKEIQADRLVLERQGERNELILRDFSQSPAATPQPPRVVRPGQSPPRADDPRMARPPRPPGSERVAPPRPPPRPPQATPNGRRPLPQPPD